jgi:hypothetical protein
VAEEQKILRAATLRDLYLYVLSWEIRLIVSEIGGLLETNGKLGFARFGLNWLTKDQRLPSLLDYALARLGDSEFTGNGG